MSELRWSTLYKPAGAGYQKIRKLKQEKTFEHEGDLLSLTAGGRGLTRLDGEGREVFNISFYDKPDQVVVDDKNDRVVTRRGNTLTTYDLETGALGRMRYLDGHHRREMYVDDDGEIHVEEGRHVFTYDASLDTETRFEVPFTTCYTGRHPASESWIFVRADTQYDSETYEQKRVPEAVLVTDEKGQQLYTAERKLALMDPTLDKLMFIEKDAEGHHVVRPDQGGKLVSSPAPNTVAVVPGREHLALLVTVAETGTSLKSMDTEGAVTQSHDFPGAPYEVFSSEDHLYVLTRQQENDKTGAREAFKDHRAPSIHRLLRLAKDGSTAEQLYQGTHHKGIVAAENRSGHLILQTDVGVLELDTEGNLLGKYSNAQGVKDRELVSRPHTLSLYFGPELSPGWVAFTQRGLGAHSYPAPYQSEELPYLSRDGTLNYPVSIDAKTMRAELATEGLAEPSGFVATGQRFLPLPEASLEEASAENRVMDHYAVGADQSIYIIEKGKRPEKKRYTRADEKVSAYLPVKGEHSQYLLTGLEDGTVELSGWLTSRYDIGSPVQALTAAGDRLLATGADGSCFVQQHFETLKTPEPSLVADLELFQHFYNRFPDDKELPIHELASRVFDLTRGTSESMRKERGDRAVELLARLPAERSLEVAQRLEATTLERDLESLHRFQQLLEPHDGFAAEFDVYRRADERQQQFLQGFVERKVSIVPAVEVLPNLRIEEGLAEQHLANLERLEKRSAATMWSDYALVLGGPGRADLPKSTEALLALYELHSGQSRPHWSVSQAFRTLIAAGGGPEEIKRWGHLIASDGVEALETALLAENMRPEEIDLKFEPNFLEVGDHLVGRD